MYKNCSEDGCNGAHYAKGYCEKHYQRWKKYGTAENKKGDHVPLADKFWNSVNKDAECWEWRGFRKKGYGRTWLEGKNLRAHRASWILTHGPIPDGLFVLHRCDNPSCVNPSHLFLGTHQDNMDDKTAKGRCAHLDRRGEKGGNARLNRDQVTSIRADTRPQKDIAAHYGLDPSTISDIKRRKSWTHI